jgi:formylglycine-generating enzyme required for sulfatase activity
MLISNKAAFLRRYIMLKRALVVFAAVIVLCSLNACEKKPKKEKPEEAVSEKANPAIVPGEMVGIPAGEFIMGTDSKAPTDAWANPQHKLSLPAFMIDKYEVTNLQYMEFTSSTGYAAASDNNGNDWRSYFTPDKEQFPVLHLSLKDAEAYCKSVGKRMPTEEEWEKAARGPNGNAYPWGNEWAEGHSNTAEAGVKEPSAIGSFNDVSSYGVHDMLGNVQEYTSSGFSAYKGNPNSVALNKSLPDKRYVVRGLSARIPGRNGHLWNRSGFLPTNLFDTGFRCAKDATPEEAGKAAK